MEAQTLTGTTYAAAATSPRPKLSAMKSRIFDPLALDVQAAAKQGAELAGEWPLTELARLRDSAHPDAAPSAADTVEWRVCSEQRSASGGQPQVWLHLQARAVMSVQCQRCLKALPVALEVDRDFRFVEGEDEAAALDEQLEEDVLESTRSLDLRQLVEDELLLALPLVPRHEACPTPLPLLDDEPLTDEARDNPFAALSALRSSGPDGTRH